jgi:epimerase transport system membrane fusion protein
VNVPAPRPQGLVPGGLDATLAAERRMRRIGMAIVLVVFVGFGGWAALAPLSSAAHAPGMVAVESYRKTLQHLEGGIVKSIEVRDGQAVEKDQVLITLDGTQSRAQLEVLRGQYYGALAREARLVAQRDGLAEPRFPDALLARREEARVHEAIQVQEQTFRVRKAAHDNEVALYDEQVRQLEAKAQGLAVQRTSRDRLVASYSGELKDFKELLDQGYADKQKVRELERSLSQAEGELGELVSELAAVKLQISETKLKILQLEKDMQREVAAELAEVQAELFELQERLQSLEDTVARTEIRAPQSGVVLGLAVHTLGAVIQPGQKLMDLVPRGERLIVEARVAPIDIDRVHEGQTAEIRFSAFRTRDTPRVDGKVVSLSADHLVDERDASKAPYYLARVEITRKGLEDLAQSELQLVAGMPAEVLINTGERTLLGYLVNPLRDTVARSFIED